MTIHQIGYKQSDTPDILLEANDGDTVGGKVPIHDVRDAPSIETGLATVASALSGISTAANQTSSNTKLDTLHTDLTAIDSHVDGLETLVTATNTKLDTVHTDLGTIDTHVDGLETLVTSTNTKLDTLHTDLGTIATNQGVPSGGPKVERKTSVGTGLSTQFATQALTHGLTLFNESTTIDLRWGTSSGSANYQVVPPRSYSVFIECSNANVIFIGSASSTVDCSYSGA